MSRVQVQAHIAGAINARWTAGHRACTQLAHRPGAGSFDEWPGPRRGVDSGPLNVLQSDNP
jgi:hypothetical protein